MCTSLISLREGGGRVSVCAREFEELKVAPHGAAPSHVEMNEGRGGGIDHRHPMSRTVGQSNEYYYFLLYPNTTGCFPSVEHQKSKHYTTVPISKMRESICRRLESLTAIRVRRRLHCARLCARAGIMMNGSRIRHLHEVWQRFSSAELDNVCPSRLFKARFREQACLFNADAKHAKSWLQ